MLLNLPTVAQVLEVRKYFSHPHPPRLVVFQTVTKELLRKLKSVLRPLLYKRQDLLLALFVMLYNLRDPPGQTLEWLTMPW